MSTKYFPQLKDFYQRFIEAVKESGQEQPFLKKWGLETLEDVYAILDNNIQGGYDSHKQSMTAAKTGGTVLTVGPGMGLCAFLLTEQFDKVYVAEPDGENCAILQTISQKFTTAKNKPAENIMNTLHAGLSITQDAVDYWEAKVALMKERNMKGSILNFDIKGAAELKNTFHEKVARIYLHKVLSSLSIASTFEDVVAECLTYLEPGGQFTWSEPDYVYDDISEDENAEPGTAANIAAIEEKLKPLIEKHNMKLEIMEYNVSEKDGETTVDETWILVKIAA